MPPCLRFPWQEEVAPPEGQSFARRGAQRAGTDSVARGPVPVRRTPAGAERLHLWWRLYAAVAALVALLIACRQPDAVAFTSAYRYLVAARSDLHQSIHVNGPRGAYSGMGGTFGTTAESPRAFRATNSRRPDEELEAHGSPGRARVPPLERLPCPLCKRSLEPTKGRHGLVWLCRTCRAGAATLPILRQVAPRDFVNHLWQAALHNGCPSALVCPSCARPFTRFLKPRGVAQPQLEVCVGCFWVWLGSESFSSHVSAGELPPPLDQTRALVRRVALPPSPSAAVEARQALGSLAARVIRRVL